MMTLLLQTVDLRMSLNWYLSEGRLSDITEDTKNAL